jgi:hypothetical protein
MKSRAVSSVFIALFLVILSFGTIFALLYSMQFQPQMPQSELNLHVSYGNGYFNITNDGPAPVQINYIFIKEPDGKTYVSTFQTTVLQGQTVPVFMGKYLQQGTVVSVETSEGVKTVEA